MNLAQCLTKVEEIIHSPKKMIEDYHQKGRKVIGILPYHMPEELFYALGFIPMGLWGASIETDKAKRYFPAFFCGMLQTELEMLLSHRLDSLDAIVSGELCDSLKCFTLNALSARKDMKFYLLKQSLNRHSSSGFAFMKKNYLSLIKEMEKDFGLTYQEENLIKAIEIYNENRTLLKEFSLLAASHLNSITPLMRKHIFACGYFMDRKEHNLLLKEINECLREKAEEKFDGMRVITAGILADNEMTLAVMEKYHIGIVGDEVSKESRDLALVEEKNLDSLVARYCSLKGMSLLDNSAKNRRERILSLVKEKKADGVIYFLTKFCDVEEYDYPNLRNALEEEGYPCILLEVDKSIKNSGQAETILEAFSEN